MEPPLTQHHAPGVLRVNASTFSLDKTDVSSPALLHPPPSSAASHTNQESHFVVPASWEGRCTHYLTCGSHGDHWVFGREGSGGEYRPTRMFVCRSQPPRETAWERERESSRDWVFLSGINDISDGVRVDGALQPVHRQGVRPHVDSVFTFAWATFRLPHPPTGDQKGLLNTSAQEHVRQHVVVRQHPHGPNPLSFRAQHAASRPQSLVAPSPSPAPPPASIPFSSYAVPCVRSGVTITARRLGIG